MKTNMKNQEGSALIIAMMVVVVLIALAVAVMDPVSTSGKISTEVYKARRVTMAADAAAERVKVIMCQTAATSDDGCSPAVNYAVAGNIFNRRFALTCPVHNTDIHIVYPLPFPTTPHSCSVPGCDTVHTVTGTPPVCPTDLICPQAECGMNLIQTDRAGVNFPAIDMKDASGQLVFNPENALLKPQTINTGDFTTDYLTYTYDDNNGGAISYISAVYDGEVLNMRVSYNRRLGVNQPSPVYLRAAYAGNDWTTSLFTFVLQNGTRYRTSPLILDPATGTQPDTGQPGCLNLQKTQSKGWLGFNIPNVNIRPGSVPKLKVYLNNIPGNNTGWPIVSIKNLGAPNNNWMTDAYLNTRPELSRIYLDGERKRYVEFPLTEAQWNPLKGQSLYTAFDFVSGGQNANSTVHFKFKDGNEPYITYENEYGVQDSIAGDIFIDGNADIEDGIVTGETETTGTVTGDGTGDELPGSDDIPAPDLSPTGDWYESLGLQADGTSTNPLVITDKTDGTADNKIAGIICQIDSTGESSSYRSSIKAKSPAGVTVYELDSNFGVECKWNDPTYDYRTDSTIVTVPAAYNDKAIYVKGDLWIDILDPINIDFKSSDGKAVTLNLIVTGNVYMTDGLNNLSHSRSLAGGLFSVIALKDPNRTDTTGNITYGDPSTNGGQIDPISSFLYAENDFKWLAAANGQGIFQIFGNMTAGGRIDFTARTTTVGTFLPIDVDFNSAILNGPTRARLAMIPPDRRITFIPGSPFSPRGTQYLP
ncbi:MAG: hypothetical protein ABIF71_06115 [Planctomycetota bacterium]